jgi:predicted GNAT family acetyltransferase
MGWYMTSDLDRFLAAAGDYLRSRAAENALLLSAAQAAQTAQAARDSRAGQVAHDSQAADEAATGPGPLFGWWDPPDGSGPRGAFLHDPSVPLLIAGRAPETAAALAAALAKSGRFVSGVDGPASAADAFAAAWSQRAGLATRVHGHSRVYRLTETAQAQNGPAGRFRIAAAADRALLVGWLRAFGTEVGELTGSPEAAADDLLSYGGAVFWEAAGHPVAMAGVTRPVARTVRISMLYTPPERRRNGYAAAVMLAVSRAALDGQVHEVVLITDETSPQRLAARIGYELIGERAVLRFGPPTGPQPRLATGPQPRLATGPQPRLATGPQPRLRG